MATQLALYFSAPPPTSAGTAVLVPGSGDTKVLNYALALETLEAELYRQAYTRLTGTTPDGSAPTYQSGSTGVTTINGLGVSATDADAVYLKRFASIEADHRNFLTNALGGNWVTNAKAYFNFGINNLTRLQVVQLVYIAELTGVSAYLGAIPYFATKTYLATAAAILGTEARHTTTVSITLNGPLFNTSPKIATAPLSGDVAQTIASNAFGIDTPLVPDSILYAGGAVPSDLLPGGVNPFNNTTNIGNVTSFVFA